MFCDFQYYDSKHLENILTKVIQLKWFPQKFDVDKRKSHLSSLIVSGQILRDDAIQELLTPMCDIQEMDQNLDFVLDKLDISKDEFNTYLNRPGKQHFDYPVDKIYNFFIITKQLINKTRALRLFV